METSEVMETSGVACRAGFKPTSEVGPEVGLEGLRQVRDEYQTDSR